MATVLLRKNLGSKRVVVNKKTNQFCKNKACMTLDAILSDWKDYEVKKRAKTADTEWFDGREEWEVIYLLKKIKNIYPFIPDAAIRNNIKVLAKEAEWPCGRNVFVKNVLIRLKIPL